MPYCPNCGKQNPDSAKFCTNCGAALQEITSEQKTIPPSSSSPPPLESLSIGTKVSFAAADGKTYTGTIIEIQGEQYKIKYDAFNFETWLKRNQFTVITGTTTNIPSYSSTSQNVYQRPGLTNTSSPALSFLGHAGFWSSLVIIIGFFVHWISYGYGYGFSGLNYLTGSIEAMGSGGNEEWRLIVILICMLMIIISPLICLLHIFGAGMGKSVFSFFKTLPLIAFAGWIALLLSNTNENLDVGELFKVFGVGAYMTLIGSIVLLASGSRRR